MIIDWYSFYSVHLIVLFEIHYKHVDTLQTVLIIEWNLANLSESHALVLGDAMITY